MNGYLFKRFSIFLLLGLLRPVQAQELYTAEHVRDLETRLETVETALSALGTSEAISPAYKGDDMEDSCSSCYGWDDCSFQLNVYGRAFMDNVWFSDLSGAVPQPFEGYYSGFGDSRLGIEGYVASNVYFRVELGLGNEERLQTNNSDVSYADVYGEVQHIPLIGNVRFGHFVEPLSLERLSRKEYISFMERSAATQNFAPARNFGVMFYDNVLDNPNLSWYAGAFRGGFLNDRWEQKDLKSDWSVTGRVAWLPYFDETERGLRLLHVGVGGSARRTGSNSGRPGNGDWNGVIPLADAESLLLIKLAPDSEFNVQNVELSGVWGPFSAQAEGYYAETNAIHTSGYYLQGSFFLTGESRSYDRRMKAFRRVYPNIPFVGRGCECGMGPGAWEIAVRYGSTDLNNLPALVNAGILTTPPTVIGDQKNWTLGLNWYLNAHTRLMLNYVRSETFYTFIGTSTGDHVGARFAIDF